MRPTIRPLLFPLLLGGILGACGAAATPDAAVPLSTTVTLRIPSTAHLPNPHALPPSTHVTLTSRGRKPPPPSLSSSSSSSSLLPAVARTSFFSAPLSVHDTFVVRNVTAGSYLVDVHCATHAFAPLRLDVVVPAPATAGDREDRKKHGDGEEDAPVVAGVVVRAWETYRGNAWDNRGEAVRVLDSGALELRLLGAKNYFMERSTFSVFSILRNPMILLGLVSMAIFIGMPKLVENMDPEMRAEWEERQKSNPMNSLMGGGAGPSGGNPMSSFDMAAFLSGSSSSASAPTAGGGAEQPGGDKRAGGGKGEGRKKK